MKCVSWGKIPTWLTRSNRGTTKSKKKIWFLGIDLGPPKKIENNVWEVRFPFLFCLIKPIDSWRTIKVFPLVKPFLKSLRKHSKQIQEVCIKYMQSIESESRVSFESHTGYGTLNYASLTQSKLGLGLSARGLTFRRPNIKMSRVLECNH